MLYSRTFALENNSIVIGEFVLFCFFFVVVVVVVVVVFHLWRINTKTQCGSWSSTNFS